MVSKSVGGTRRRRVLPPHARFKPVPAAAAAAHRLLSPNQEAPSACFGRCGSGGQDEITPRAGCPSPQALRAPHGRAFPFRQTHTLFFPLGIDPLPHSMACHWGPSSAPIPAGAQAQLTGCQQHSDRPIRLPQRVAEHSTRPRACCCRFSLLPLFAGPGKKHCRDVSTVSTLVQILAPECCSSWR